MTETSTMTQPTPTAEPTTTPTPSPAHKLSARIEPFDSYWQAPEDVEAGYKSFATYYQANILPHLPGDRGAKVLVVSAGPGYLINLLKERGYTAVTGVDSDPAKAKTAAEHGLDVTVSEAFPFLEGVEAAYDMIICEQELSHLTHGEMIDWLKLCHRALVPGGRLFVYGLNGANPLVGSENLAHNIDHFNTFTEYSLKQVLELADFADIQPRPLKLYVFWTNPLNYVGLAVTAFLELGMKAIFKLYGKKVSILTKKIAATARKPA